MTYKSRGNPLVVPALRIWLMGEKEKEKFYGAWRFYEPLKGSDPMVKKTEEPYEELKMWGRNLFSWARNHL